MERGRSAPGPTAGSRGPGGSPAAWGSGRSCRAVLPAACPAGPGRGGQQGLEIVIAVCRCFQVRREPLGKRVRAAIVLADGPGGDPAGRLL